MTLLPARRRWLGAAAMAAGGLALPRIAAGLTVVPASLIRFPHDTGAHPHTRIEWWYVTGTLAVAGPPAGAPAPAPSGSAPAPSHGFQITFFRAATGIAPGAAASSTFAARDVVFAHAALSDVRRRRHVHDQRVARPGFGVAAADTGNTRVRLRDWSLDRGAGEASRYTSRIDSAAGRFRLDLAFDATQPAIHQGTAGFSLKGPDPANFSYYYSEPQLAVRGRIAADDGPWQAVTGRAWLDHEWSDALLPPGAVGWDWIGFNLDDGGALMAFQIRRADGSVLWAGGSYRASAVAPLLDLHPLRTVFKPRTHWQSPASNARYPVAWDLDTQAGSFRIEALFPAQELGALAGSGAVYWEGLSKLVDAQGRTVGHGYLEMTGYASPLRI